MSFAYRNRFYSSNHGTDNPFVRHTNPYSSSSYSIIQEWQVSSLVHNDTNDNEETYTDIQHSLQTLERCGWLKIFHVDSPTANNKSNNNTSKTQSCLQRYSIYTTPVPLAKIVAQIKWSLQDTFYSPVVSKLVIERPISTIHHHI